MQVEAQIAAFNKQFGVHVRMANTVKDGPACDDIMTSIFHN
jgi:hypothetical protein